MYHPACRQPVALRDFGLTSAAAAQLAALGQQLRPGGAMYRTVHPAAAQQRGIGSINYRVHRQRGDVGLAYFQSGIHIDFLKF